MGALLKVLSVKRYESLETPVKVSFLVDVYVTEKNWFDEDNSPKV